MNLADLTEEQLFKRCTKLFLTSGDQFVASIANRLNYPKFLDARVGYSMILEHLKIMIPKGENGFHEIESLPIVASVTFFASKTTGEIVAISYPCSLLIHKEIYKEKLVQLFTGKTNVFSDGATEDDFYFWCSQNFENKKESDDLYSDS